MSQKAVRTKPTSASSRKPPAPDNIGQQSAQSNLDQIRTWRDGSQALKLYPTAIFWGEQVVANATHTPIDCYRLANAYFDHADYHAASAMLNSSNIVSTSIAARYLAGQCCVKLKQWEQVILCFQIDFAVTPANPIDLAISLSPDLFI